MSENVENLLLEHLRALRAGQERMESDLNEIKHRLLGVETGLVGLRRDGTATQEDVYRQQGAIDGIKDRLTRIERRLELRDME